MFINLQIILKKVGVITKQGDNSQGWGSDCYARVPQK